MRNVRSNGRSKIATNDEWPTSIRAINKLPEEQKFAIYEHLLPEWLFAKYGIERHTFRTALDTHPVVTFRCPDGSRAMELTVKRRSADMDPIMYLNMADTFNNQLLVLLVIVNDPESARYNTDVDQHGNPTQFGTVTRNIPAEIAAMRAGLAPGQIRRGLRAFKESVPLFDEFVARMGHDIFFIEPLAYHNAIIFERYGFNYLSGRSEMQQINQDLQPGGVIHAKLNGSTPFRSPDAWKSVRGRSWAIHDGILGHPFTGFQMYKRVNVDAGVNTFPGSKW